MSKTTNKFSPEVRGRAGLLVLETEVQHGSRWHAVMSIAAKIGSTSQCLNDGNRAHGSTTNRDQPLANLAQFIFIAG